ncbi:O-antigen ligase family protein [Sulfitobacter sp. MF3-043]|uniref:O-antigen ligase family protein n=1 Tax=Sulfitobacter sediminivivens TaxID=3252902 RepID=UPI0036DB4E8F
MTLVTHSGRQTGGRIGAQMVTKADRASSKHGMLIAIMLLSFVMPFFFSIGGLKLSAYRLYLLVAAFPVVIGWMKGNAGPIRSADILVIAAALWMAAALFINHGIAAQWEFSGMLVVETVVPYLTARVLIRDYASFRTFVWWYFTIVLLLLPFALFENLTGKSVLLDLFRPVFQVYYKVNQEPRMGLFRAQVSFPHSILFGAFCASAFALSWYVLSHEKGIFKRIIRPFLVGTAVFSSLSSGAFLAIILQAFLTAWDEILKSIKNRWKIFAIIFSILYIILELASNRNAFQIIASELTFSSGSAWNRIHIFNNSIDDIFGNPFFGIGLKEWTRPSWMKSSVDNFWLLVALRYGIPAFIMLGLAAIMTCWRVGRTPLTGLYARARTGYLIAFASLSMAAFTVHLWDAAYCFLMFLLGCGMWFVDTDQAADVGQTGGKTASGKRTIRYTRFSQKSSGASGATEIT